MQKESLLIDKLEEIVGDKTIKEVDEIFYNTKAFMTYYRCAILEIETKFNVLNEQFSLRHERNPIEYIKSRLKSFESIAEKLKRKNLPVTLETVANELNDVAGVRVICSFIDDIYLLANCLINQDDVKLIKMKDYIKNPKASGYKSYHMIVSIPIYLSDRIVDAKVEIQIRTVAMDFWASLEHKIHYKFEGNAPEYIKDDLFECAKMVSELDAKMLSLNEEIQQIEKEMIEKGNL